MFREIIYLSRESSTKGLNAVMCRLTTGIRSEKCVVRRFRRRAKVVECI